MKATFNTIDRADTLQIPEVVIADTKKSLTGLQQEIHETSSLPDNTTALKNIQRNNGKAMINAMDNDGKRHSIEFNKDGVQCNGIFFKPTMGGIGLGIKNIQRDTDQGKFIIQGKLGFVSKQVPMPLENANWLVHQIMQVSTKKMTDTEIAIPHGNGAKLIVQ